MRKKLNQRLSSLETYREEKMHFYVYVVKDASVGMFVKNDGGCLIFNHR